MLSGAADDLVQRRLIDGDTKFVFQPRDIFADHVIGVGILQYVGDRLALLRIGVEWWVGHIGDLENEALGLIVALRRARDALRCAENRLDNLRRDEATGFSALKIGCGLDLEAGIARDLRESSSRLELAKELVRFCLQALADLVVTPARGHLVFHFIERAFTRRRYAGDVEIEITATRQLQRLSVDANIAGKGGVDHVRILRQPGDGLAVGRAPGAVDRLNVDRLETKFLGGLG